MTDKSLRQELSSRFAALLKDDNAAFSVLQLLGEDTRYVDSNSGDHWSGPFAALAEDFASLKGQTQSKRSVGIWEEEEGTGDFVRSRKHIDLWRFCADVERIGKKGEKKRIVLLGESVARGFFFDPVYSPAKVLREQLSAFSEPVEVVDLAQSNCDPWWLSKIAASVPLLEPDAVVVFAGNNWRVGSLANTSAETFKSDGDLIEEDGGFSKLLGKQLQRLERFAGQVVTKLASSLTPLGVPVVFVIPEINVADWTSAPVSAFDTPLMSSEDTRSWVSAYEAAKQALDAGEFDAAEESVRRAIELDGGTSSSSLELLARIQRGLGKRSRDIYETLRKSRDIIEDTRVVPGVFVTVAETIRRVAPEVGATIVDLPQLFGDRYEHEIPGRRLYLDFCHHTSEGMRVSMAAVAQKLLPALFKREAHLEDLIDAASKPAPEHEAWAHLLAGIHNAHWGQDPEVCAFHFRRAREYDPKIATTGIALVYDAYRRKTPQVLLPEFDQLVKNEIAEVCLVGYSPLARGIIKEQALLDAIASAFPEIVSASEGPELSLGNVDEIDLLQSHSTELTDRNRWYRRAYSAAYGTTSKYTFSSQSAQDLSISVTSRIPEAVQAGEIVVELNGKPIAQATLKDQWVALRTRASAGVVKAGLNELTIRWPNVPRNDIRARLRKDFEAGQKVDIRRQFGQLHDLTVAAVA
ncbi:hypothetical protein [Trinickia diaoshuihuensis]|uniref:hypothetical protein n=1 Tax=Trinickia diaoshuihuensis TaxID=2292265 RepID=UPI000E23CADD|nr:hypothetical protein [Trinickia diaoshuihuensis]